MTLHPRRRLPLLLATLPALLGAPLTACSGAAPPATSDRPLAEVRHGGGMCSDGPCGGTLTVTRDGRWTWEGASGTEIGQLGVRQLHRLQDAVDRTRLDVEPRNAPAGPPDCGADHDGLTVGYGWADAETGWTEASSCEQHLDHRDPLARELEGLERRLAP